jgi:hypothetical protein
MPKKTLRELQKSKFLTIVDDNKGIIKKIVSPNNFQVGADTDLLPSSLSVYGNIVAGEGVSGSLTQLKDGTSYLIAGTNITIVSESNGPITISSTGTAPGAGGDDTQIQFNNNSALDGDSSFTFNDSSKTLTVTNMSGSLTRLTNGTSYLIAGTNITITTQSNGSVIINSTGGGGGGSVDITSGSNTVSTVTEIIFDDGLFMVDNGDNTATITSTIGVAEDGTYTDGLYTDFNSETPIGTAIDRFNEILKLLAPAPAPNLDDIDVNVDGVDAQLSFGSSNDLESESTPYYSVGTAAGFTAVDVNGTYSTSTSGNNLRAAIFNGSQNITGDLNEDVSSDGNNYPANSFGNADQGELRLEVNGSVVHTVDLTSFTGTGSPGSGTGTSQNGNGSGFTHLSETDSGTLDNGTEFENFKHRTGRYVVNSSDQRQGWNYARVLHVIGGSTTTTNYVEWVNDADANSLAATSETLSFTGGSIIDLSGVKYFTDGSATYQVTVNNAYRNIYDTNNISFSTSNAGSLNSGVSFSLASQSKPTIDTSGGEDHTKSLSLTATDSSIGASYMLNGSLTAGVNVTHPLKSNLSNAGQATTSGILLYNLSNTSTDTTETFRRENFRIISASYDTQASLVDSSNEWNSSTHMTSSNAGHENGLQFYNQRLYSPTNTLNSGDFTTFSNAPGNQPDYSSETGLRTFYRWFKNTTGSTKYEFSISINGSGSTIVSDSTSLNSGRIRVLVKFPSDGSRETGWLDLAEEFVLDQYEDGDGAHLTNGALSFDSTLNATNYVSLGTIGVENNEYIGVKIEADATWSGYISQISVDFNAASGTTTPIPDLDDMDCNDTGVTANLSFGSTKSITGYENVGTIGTFSSVALNGTYQSLTNSNNLRRAVFDKTVDIEGELNEDVASAGDSYVANSFSDANSGSLKLEVNGSVVHTVDLTGVYNAVGAGSPGSGTGTNLNGNGSGFVNFSTWKASEYSNDIPNYREIYRTGTYRVNPADQRDGWNYVRVLHSLPGLSDRTTNYVEWVNDSESQNDNISTTNLNAQQFGDDNSYFSSGVEYFIQPTGSIEATVSNLYKNVYSNSTSAIQITGTVNATAQSITQNGDGITSSYTENDGSASLQSLNTTTDSQNNDLFVTGSLQFNQSVSLTGSFIGDTGSGIYSCGARLFFRHPIKTDHTTSTIQTTNLLVYSASDNSNKNTNEYFNGEVNRLQKTTYSGQDAVTNAANAWDSKISINDNDTYPNFSTGLLVFDGLLISPLKGGDDGNFRNKHETSNPGIFEGPDNNKDYTSLTHSTRNYIRGFLNNTTNDRPSISVKLYGDANLVGKTGANQGTLGANKNFTFELKIPGKTGWLDLGKPSAGSGNISDGDGCLSGDLNATVGSSGTTNICTFNGQTADGTVSGAEYVLINVSADEDWTGYLSRIDIAWST